MKHAHTHSQHTGQACRHHHPIIIPQAHLHTERHRTKGASSSSAGQSRTRRRSRASLEDANMHAWVHGDAPDRQHVNGTRSGMKWASHATHARRSVALRFERFQRIRHVDEFAKLRKGDGAVAIFIDELKDTLEDRVRDDVQIEHLEHALELRP